MDSTPNVSKLQQAIEGTMSALQRRYFIPLQKDTFLCSASCCDAARDMNDLLECTHRCSGRIQAAEQAIHQQMHEFQGRVQRCMVRCQDTAQEALPREPSSKDMDAAQAKLGRCVDACASEYSGLVPKLQADIEGVLKRVAK